MMMTNQFMLGNRADNFSKIINGTVYTTKEHAQEETELGFRQFTQLLMQKREAGKAVYIIGNGGSAAVASHTLTDFVNVCKLRAFTLHDSSLMTCMANDFGYDVAFKRIVEACVSEEDVLICISSSGKSVNMHNAAIAASAAGAVVVTLSGFHADNQLRKLGDMNFWLNSHDYGFVEIGHLFLLHNIVDRIGEMEKQKQQQKNTSAVINI